jgi:glycosyltransferase involved in cell wall biosynthesis
MPKVSVITPVYNGEKYLEETILSVLNQTFSDFEYLIVDHASTDSCIDIMRKYQSVDNRIKIIQLNTNKGGPAYPRNEGIRVSQGKYLAFVDADDVWKPHKLQTQIDFFDTHNDIDILYTHCDIIDENGVSKGRAKNQILKNLLGIFMEDSSLIFYVNFINVNTLIIKKDGLTPFNEEPYLIAIEDWMFHIFNFQAGKKGFYQNESLLDYRVHCASLSNRLSDKSYRKIFYMYSLLFLESKISFFNFLLANTLNTAKLLRRKLVISWSSK